MPLYLCIIQNLSYLLSILQLSLSNFSAAEVIMLTIFFFGVQKGQQAKEEHAESKSTQPQLSTSPLSVDQVLKMPLFDDSIDMEISPSDPSMDDFWIDPDMWNSDSDDPTDSVCSILLEDAQSCTFPVDVPQCNLNLGSMDELFDFVGGSPNFDGLWIPAH